MIDFEKQGTKRLLQSILEPKPVVHHVEEGRDLIHITYDKDTETFEIFQRLLGEEFTVIITEDEINAINKFIKNGKQNN